MKTKELEFTPKQVSLSKVFNKVPEKLLEGYDDLTLSSKILLCVINNGAGINKSKDDKGPWFCSFSNQVLQRKTGLSERTISASLKQLESYGIILRKTTKDGKRYIRVLIDITKDQPWEIAAVEKYRDTHKYLVKSLFEDDEDDFPF